MPPWRRLATELNLSRTQLYLSATHTHASIGGWGQGLVGEAFAGEFQPGARIWLADRIAAAVRDAVHDLKPASFGHGRFSAPEFIRNRLVGAVGKVDPEFSADYPGSWQRAVITSFNGDYIGYVISPRYYHMNGYEPRVMSFFGPCVPDYFDELIRTLALGLLDR